MVSNSDKNIRVLSSDNKNNSKNLQKMGKNNKKNQTKHKQKLSALDIRGLCTSLENRLKGIRLSNVYDVDKRNYLFKFGSAEDKLVLHLEMGNRIHAAAGEIEKKIVPSGLTMKMRKKLKGKRLESCKPVGVERVMEMIFATGEAEIRLYLEFYSKGNMILTDGDLNIIAVTRSYSYDEENKVAIGEKYPLKLAAPMSEDDLVITEETIKKAMSKEAERNKGKPAMSSAVYFSVLRSCHNGMIYPILRQFDLDPYGPLEESNSEMMDKFEEALKFGRGLFTKPMLGSGYLVRTKTENDKDTPVGQIKHITEEERIANLMNKEVIPYFEFSPILFKEYQTNPNYIVEEFDDFNEALSVYFDNLTRGNLITKEDIEEKIWQKFQNIKKDQEGRLDQIRQSKDESYHKAQLIEANIQEISAIIDIITSLMSLGMHSIVKSVISQAKKQGDVLANIIHKIDLARSQISILLGDEDNLEESLKVVDIDLNLGAYENAKKYYKKRSNLIEKEKKTEQAAQHVLENAKEAATAQLNKHKKGVKVIKTNRKVYWFEKFYWFISSENFLVISARDAQQNEAIIKKYLGKDDIVFHTQIQGSAFTLIKNPNGIEIPNSTLEEAALATLCHSKSWNLKVINEVYWVYAHQVSKTAPTGLFIGAGSFMVYGKKNFIRPRRLELGFGLMWKVDDESIERHKDERKPKYFTEEDGEAPRLMKKDSESLEIKVDENTEVTQINLALPGRFKKKKTAQNAGKKGGNNQNQGNKNQKTEEKEEEEPKTFQDLSKKTRIKKKQKYQKMLKKYGEMDDEDRIAKMKLIGAQDIQGVDQMLNFHKNKDELLDGKSTKGMSKKTNQKIKTQRKSKQE